MNTPEIESGQPAAFSSKSIYGRLGLAALVLLTASGLYTIKGFLPALVWALIFTIGLWPAYERLRRLWPKHSRGLLPAALVLAVLLLFVLPLVVIAVPLVSEVHDATVWIARARAEGVAPPAALTSLPFGQGLAAWWRQHVGQPGQLSAISGHAVHSRFTASGRAIIEQVLHRLVLLFFMLLSLFFLLRDGDAFASQVKLASYRAFGPRGELVGLQMIRSVHGTINGLVLVGLAEGVILGFVYWAAGVPHPTLFGLATALLAMVPFGAAAAFILAAIMAFAVSHVVPALIIVVLGTIITFSADHFVRPVLIGGATRLPFLWVLLGILGGLEAWGLVGLFLGPALMAALILLWREWVGEKAGPLDPAHGELGVDRSSIGAAE